MGDWKGIAVNLHPRVWFSQVWSEDGRPDGMDDWTEDHIDALADMLGEPDIDVAAVVERPLREVIWFHHKVRADLDWADAPLAAARADAGGEATMPAPAHQCHGETRDA